MKTFWSWLGSWLSTFLVIYIITLIYTQLLNRQDVGKGGENVFFVCKRSFRLRYYQCDLGEFIANQKWEAIALFVISIPLSSITFLCWKNRVELTQRIRKFLYKPV